MAENAFEKTYCLRFESADKVCPEQQDGATSHTGQLAKPMAYTQSPPWTHIPSKKTFLLSKCTSHSGEASVCWHLATRPAATAGALARSWHRPGRTLPRQPESVRLNHCPQPGKNSTEQEIWGLAPARPQISCAAWGSTLRGRSVFLPVRTGRCRLLTSRSVPSTGTSNLALPQHQELQKSPR